MEAYLKETNINIDKIVLLDLFVTRN